MNAKKVIQTMFVIGLLAVGFARAKNREAVSTLMQHLAHVADRNDVWYVANGWLYGYRYVAKNAVINNVFISNKEKTPCL